MKKIILSKGELVLVDDLDFEWLNQWKWYANARGYAVRSRYVKGSGERGIIYMHRVLNSTPDGYKTDHIDRNRLNNQRNNLRTVTESQNAMNTKLRKDNTSGYKGIWWHKKNKKWIASIEVAKKVINLGSYSNIQAAWLARRLGERLHHAL